MVLAITVLGCLSVLMLGLSIWAAFEKDPMIATICLFICSLCLVSAVSGFEDLEENAVSQVKTELNPQYECVMRLKE